MQARVRTGWLGVASLVAAVGVAAAQEAGPGGASPPIRLNTLGYLPGAAKQATVALPCEEFAVVRLDDGRRVFEGRATGPRTNADTGERLFLADFSELREPGEYRLEVAGVGQSPPFRIADDLYRQPFYLVTRGMYLWRCGCAVRGEHNGHVYEHAACHLDDARLDFVLERDGSSSTPGPPTTTGGEDAPARRERDAPARGEGDAPPRGEGDDAARSEAVAPAYRDGTGGWHDAGDFNKYVVNAGVTVGCMFRAWEDFGKQIETVALGNQGPDAASQESGGSNDKPGSRLLAPGSLPDFLAELKWETDWLLKMQADDGSVYHKLSAVHFCGFILPEEETDPRYFVPWSSAATADFVAMLAVASRHFRPYDPAYADRCLAAARKSSEFLQAHAEDHPADMNGFHTGGYGAPDWDDRLWAAAELWEATGDAAALADFEARARSAEPPRRRWRRSRDADEDDDEGNRPVVYQWHVAADWDWGNVKNLGLFTYLFSGRPGRDPALVEQIRESLIETADRIVETRNSHGYARPLGERYYWGCNGTVARQVVVLEAARRIVDKPEYRATSLDALNHLFGRNVHCRSYVTGLGHRPPMHPHDRRSAADAIAVPWPGYLVGGPHPRAVDWHDDESDYRTNEIAINWNGALIYALAAFLDERDAMGGAP